MESCVRVVGVVKPLTKVAGRTEQLLRNPEENFLLRRDRGQKSETAFLISIDRKPNLRYKILPTLASEADPLLHRQRKECTVFDSRCCRTHGWVDSWSNDRDNCRVHHLCQRNRLLLSIAKRYVEHDTIPSMRLCVQYYAYLRIICEADRLPPV